MKNQIYQYNFFISSAPRLVITWSYVCTLRLHRSCGGMISLTRIRAFFPLLFSFFLGFFLSKIFQSPLSMAEHYDNKWTLWKWIYEYYGLISSGLSMNQFACLLKKGFWQIKSLWSLSLSISVTLASHFSRVVRALADSIKGTVSRIIIQPCTHGMTIVSQHIKRLMQDALQSGKIRKFLYVAQKYKKFIWFSAFIQENKSCSLALYLKVYNKDQTIYVAQLYKTSQHQTMWIGISISKPFPTK